MERLVDPLTTVDAKLWADEFMKVKARLGEQEFDHAMMLGWFANAIMQGYDEGQRRAKADAQATVEALQRERDHAKKMEAVQKEVADNQTWHVRELRTALDAEREKVTQVSLDLQAAWRREADLQTKLSQLQALVRAYCEAKVTFDDGRLREDHHAWKERFERLTTAEQALIATLPATPTERGEDHSGDDTDMVQKGGGDGE